MKRPAAEAEMKPILLIRPDNNQSDADALAEAGIASVTEPLLEIVPAPDPGPGRALARLLGEANSVTWLVVTSPRAWGQWLKLVPGLETMVADALDRGLKVATVGLATTKSLPDTVHHRSVTQPGISAEGLLDFLVTQPAGIVLLPASARSRKVLPEGLRAAGWQVHQATVYDTVPRSGIRLPELEKLGGVLVRSPSAPRSGIRLPELEKLGGVLVRSPSAASALAALIAVPPPGFTVFAVGPITAARCRELGWQPIEIGATTTQVVVESVLRHESGCDCPGDGSMLEP